MKKLCKLTQEFVPLSELTTFKIGGVARFVCFPQNFKELIKLKELCAKRNISHFILGNGSNCLIKDEFFDGIVICTKKLNRIKLKNDGVVTVECGVLLPKLCSFCVKNGLSGLEALCGIPATIGGAVKMNAGAFGTEIGDVVECVTVFENGKTIKLDKSKLFFQYRKSVFTKSENCVILSVVLRLKKSTSLLVQSKIKEFTLKRSATQNVGYPSAGSVFKKNVVPSSKLIADCGLKGARIGGAMVSNVHAGFIVNLGGATCVDVLNLIALIKREVKKKFSVELELELIILGGEK